MRRTDREKDRFFALEVLRDCPYATLATTNPDGTPYCVPISPVLLGNTVYFHCATEGQKLTNIVQNPSVCVSCVGHTKLRPEKFTTEYESALLTGDCQIVSDETEKAMALRVIAEKYAKSNLEHVETKIAESLHRTCVCKIEVKQVSGKGNIL